MPAWDIDFCFPLFRFCNSSISSVCVCVFQLFGLFCVGGRIWNLEMFSISLISIAGIAFCPYIDYTKITQCPKTMRQGRDFEAAAAVTKGALPTKDSAKSFKDIR